MAQDVAGEADGDAGQEVEAAEDATEEAAGADEAPAGEENAKAPPSQSDGVGSLVPGIGGIRTSSSISGIEIVGVQSSPKISVCRQTMMPPVAPSRK